jgi:hypothetical protein
MNNLTPNTNRVHIEGGVTVSYPDENPLMKADYAIISDVIGSLELISGARKIHSVHVNKDSNNAERLYGINFVFIKK